MTNYNEIIIRDKSIHRSDGWMNLLSGLGRLQDKSIHTTYNDIALLDDHQLSNLYAGEGFSTRIIDCVADDALKNWIEIENDKDNTIIDGLDDLKVQSKFNIALKWKRLFGGSLIIMGIMDGRDVDKPVDIKNISSIEWLEVVDRTQVDIGLTEFVDDINDKDFGKVKVYTVYTGINGTPHRIHHSRVLEFKGKPAPYFIDIRNQNIRYWGMSVLQPVWEKLKSLGSSLQSLDVILQEFLIGKYKLKDIARRFAENNEQSIIKRIEIINMYKSVINGVILDSEEDYTRDTANLTGLSDILDRLMIFVSGVSGIPVTKLFGRSPAGQNSTGESDANNYNDMVLSTQKKDLYPQLQILVNLLVTINKKEDNNLNIVFNPLSQISSKDRADITLKEAQADHIRVEDQVLSSEEVRNIRYPLLGSN